MRSNRSGVGFDKNQAGYKMPSWQGKLDIKSIYESKNAKSAYSYFALPILENQGGKRLAVLLGRSHPDSQW